MTAAAQSDITATIGARLRAARTAARLSLAEVETKSGGRWKAVVVGSYERGDRNVTAERLVELAAWYGVPVSTLLPDQGEKSAVQADELAIEALTAHARTLAGIRPDLTEALNRILGWIGEPTEDGAR